MSYGIRNTLILAFVLLLFLGSGFGYIHFYQKSMIEELELSLEEKEVEYAEMSEIAETFPFYSQAVEEAQNFIETFDKTLFPINDTDRIFKFLSEINLEAPRVEFEYLYSDSTAEEEYGIITSTITGYGPYQSIYTFINRIENSRPVQKIENLQVSPVNRPDEYGHANFNFTLNSYYNRTEHFDTTEEDLTVAGRYPDRFHNPFYPLIREPEPNVDNLVEVDNSRLIGVSQSRIFLRNQHGELINLSLNDPVYLGQLTEINSQQGRATFRLNRGGIIEEVTLEVQR